MVRILHRLSSLFTNHRRPASPRPLERRCRLAVESLEDRVVPAFTVTTLPIQNMTNLDPSQYTVWVAGESAVDNLVMNSAGHFVAATSNTVQSYNVAQLSQIVFDTAVPDGGIILFFVTPSSVTTGPTLNRSSGSVQQPALPPYVSGQTNIPYLNDFVEFTVDANTGLLHIDVTGVTQFAIPITLTAQNASGTTLGQVGVTPNAGNIVNRQAIGNAYVSFMNGETNGSLYLPLVYPQSGQFSPNSIAGQYFTILNPTTYLSAPHTASGLDTYWHNTITSLFSTSTTLSLQGIAAGTNPSEVFNGVYDAANQRFVLTGQTSGQVYYVYNPEAGTTQQAGTLQVFANNGVFADSSSKSVNGGNSSIALNLQNQIVGAINRGVALMGLGGSGGSTTAVWGTETNWYKAGQTYNIYAKFLHAGTINGTPIFVKPSASAPFGAAYGFGYDENPGPVPPVPAGQAQVPSKFDPVPAGTVTLVITLDAWVAPGSGGGGGGNGPAQPVLPSNVVYAVGANAGGGPQVNVYNAVSGNLVASFNAFAPSFTGGVRVAVGDVNGDGFDDIICGAGPGGGPQVSVFDGKTFQLLRSFYGLQPSTFTGGVFVAVGDVNGDGFADIAVSAGAGGGPQVDVFDGKTGSMLMAFNAFVPSFTGGIRLAMGDVDGDGFADIITAAGKGGGPQVEVFSGKTGSLLTSFFAFASTFTGGVYVAAGDVNGDGLADIIAGAGAGGGPQVTIFNGKNNALLSSFFAFPAGFTGGVDVGASITSTNARPNVLTAAGPSGGPQVSIFDTSTLQLLGSFFAFPSSFTGGSFIS